MNWNDHVALAQAIRDFQRVLASFDTPEEVPGAAAMLRRLTDLLHQLSLFRDAADRVSLEQYHEQTTIYYDSPEESWTATLRNLEAEAAR